MTSNFAFGSRSSFGAWEPPTIPGNLDESRYRPFFAGADSPTLRAIWKSAYGSEYAEEAESFGFAGRTDFEFATKQLELGPGDRFLDMGCGGGGPGLWLAERTGASVFGVDIAPEAITAARRRAADRQGADGTFFVADCAHTGLDGAFDAAVAFDSLWMILDKAAAIREIARLLRVGAKLVMTTWEPPYLSYGELLVEAGFDVVDRFEPEHWQPSQLAVYRGILDHRDALSQELGAAAAQVLFDEASEAPPQLENTERIRLLAMRR
jgi:SAM-dependent methyltransferase